MALDLFKLISARNKIARPTSVADNARYRRFEEAFPFTPTADQLKCFQVWAFMDDYDAYCDAAFFFGHSSQQKSILPCWIMLALPMIHLPCSLCIGSGARYGAVDSPHGPAHLRRCRIWEDRSSHASHLQSRDVGQTGMSVLTSLVFCYCCTMVSQFSAVRIKIDICALLSINQKRQWGYMQIDVL